MSNWWMWHEFFDIVTDENRCVPLVGSPLEPVLYSRRASGGIPWHAWVLIDSVKPARYPAVFVPEIPPVSMEQS